MSLGATALEVRFPLLLCLDEGKKELGHMKA